MTDKRQDHRATPDTPQSPSPRPPLEENDSSYVLEDLLASFPKPLDWDKPFEDLGSNLFASNADAGATAESLSTDSTDQPRSSLKPLHPNKSLPAPPSSFHIRRGPSKGGKRSTEASTPRPFKRLKEAFSPKAPSPKSPPLRRTPSKIPPPASPTRPRTRTIDLERVIEGFQFTHNYLKRSISALEGFSTKWSAQQRDATQDRTAVMELMDEKRRTNIEALELQRTNDTLREELRKTRKDSGRAAQEAQGMIAHLESLLAKERALSATLRTEVNDLTRRHHFLEQTADRRVFELQQDLDAAKQETAKVKAEFAEVKSKLDEAEFAHRALKEGGARLARELADKERLVDELEKTKGTKRWGMI